MEKIMSEADAFRLLEQRRAAFTAAAAPLLAGTEVGSPADAADAADKLLGMTLAAYQGRLKPEAAAPALRREVYSRFGDNLVPLLKDIIGRDVPVAFLARCVDAYWRSAARAVDAP